MKAAIKQLILDSMENRTIRCLRKCEVVKFRDPRRLAILEQVELTESQMHEIDDYYVKNYGRKIPYTWHRHNLAISGNFDVRFFPELLFVPEFNRYMNQPDEYAKVFGDKNLLGLFADKVGVRTTRALLTRTAGVFRDADMNELTMREAIDFGGNLGKCFAKPTVDTCSGVGCGAYDFDCGCDKESGIKVEELFDILGPNFAIQEPIACHPTIADLHPESANTLRVMTYRWKGEIRVLPLLMRLGCGKSVVDNAHAGGIFVGVSERGELAHAALTEFNVRYDVHPDTGIRFEGYRIAGVEKVIAAAKRMHLAMPQLGFVGWDFTVDEAGEPLVIEANTMWGSVWLSQMANGVPAFGDDTDEILQWLKFMNGIKPHERGNFRFGYTD